jgi:hypothetical protein
MPAISFSRVLSCLPLLALVAMAPACGVSDEEDDDSAAALSEPGEGELPWEVRSRSGETYLPNVFYAEPSENEQIMPLTLDGRYQIDRLIYPTLGNPNLFVKSDARDELMTVMRLENELVGLLGATITRPVGSSRFLRHVDIPEQLRNDAKNGIHVFLVARSARAGATAANAPVAPGNGVFEVRPSAIHAHAITNDMPAAFKARQTLRFVFDRAAMANVPAGLYDVRIEVRKDGKIATMSSAINKGAFEYQYNAVRVFDSVSNDYSIINVTDTQVSYSEPGRGPLEKTSFEKTTLGHLKEFVQRVNASTEPDVRNAAFITFNGDLHNGGSPEALRPSRVAWTYNDEAKIILETLKELPVPIFLTAGNHDGYAALGHVPDAINNMLGRVVDWVTGNENGTLKKTVDAAEPKNWPGFDWDAYARFLADTKQQQGGRHVDVHVGAHRQVRGVDVNCTTNCFERGWVPVDQSKRNYMLYDGFHQWRKTYGPTNFSWRFGKSRFVNLNTYELRQHRRTGWGMYTVNYGGAMSQVQVEWLDKELRSADSDNQDVVILAHHDARGGHNGTDYPYYFKPMEYKGMDQSAGNYVQGEILNPKICQLVPTWAQTNDQVLSCLHDGLQEWMRADGEFDCEESLRYRDARGKIDGRCDEQAYSGSQHPWYSGYELLDLVMLHPSVRTMVLGHTHYNSFEVLQAGQNMVPTRLILDADAQKRHQAGETNNPFRAFSLFRDVRPEGAYDPSFLTPGVSEQDGNLVVDLAQAGHAFANHTIQGDAREIAILRLTSNSDLTSQKYVGQNARERGGDTMFGFATLHVTRQADQRGYANSQINEVTFYLNDKQGRFEAVEKKAIPRATALKTAQVDPNNPLCSIFEGAGAQACR